MINKDPIYLLTVFEKNGSTLNKYGEKDFGCRDNIGFFHEFKTIEDVVINNVTDIWETCFNYASISEIYPGIYGMFEASKVNYYKYNIELNKYEPTNEIITKCSKIKNY